VLNPPRALEACVDKYLALVRLEQAGLRVPETIVCQHADAAIEAFETLGRDVVVKPIFGSEGRGMMRIGDAELAWRTFRTLERSQAAIYVQRFVAHPGWDLRAFVLNGKVLAAIRRVAGDDWRTNVAQGAKAEPTTLTPEQESLALRAASALGAIAAGVDLLPGPNGEWFVIEVNAVPGWRALGPATGVDVARKLIECCARVPQVTEYSVLSTQYAVFQACLWEATARKAGNVHPGQSFSDVTFADFAMSAHAAAPEIGRAHSRPLGETILSAIKATRAVVKSNTNLGMVLLLAPLSKVQFGIDLRTGVRSILHQSTIDDASRVYEAIRLASPGGLGTAKSQDVREEPTQTLREVMALAADRDLIARQYANDFADVFDVGVPALIDGLRRFGRLESAIQHCQLVWLATHPDSLIQRKCGPQVAADASRRARVVLEQGGIGTAAGQAAYADFDRWLREDGNKRNPGTTADLIAACLFIALRERKIGVDTPM
jgi:triphosphoribosyl-dephospho-CoA synthase